MSKIYTYSGLLVDALNLRPQDIRLIDIAHQLALTNRWQGATSVPISVAQHAVWVARILPMRFKKTGLHHDDHEAYLGDIPAPLKGTDAYTKQRSAAMRAQRIIATIFNCGIGNEPEVHAADMLVRKYEAQYLHKAARDAEEPLTSEQYSLFAGWKPWSWMEARNEFLREAKTLHYTVLADEFTRSSAIEASGSSAAETE